MSSSVKSLSVLVLVAVVSLAMGVGAQGARLNLPQPMYPLINSDFIDVTYDASGGGGGGGRLTAIGYTAELKTSESSSEYLYGDFTLIVDIDPLTGAATWGKLELTEDYLTGVALFYSQQLTAFGFGTTLDDDILEVVFTQQGDMLASDGATIGVIMSVVGAAAPWDWTSSWDNLIIGIPGTGDGYATTLVIPEPSLLGIGGLGTLALMARRRRA